MLPNDEHFNDFIKAAFGRFPFRSLGDYIAPGEAVDRESLITAFTRVFHCPEARSAKNIVFFWAVDRPFLHDSGHQLPSTVSYIEITTGSLAGQWPTRYFRRITRDKNKGDTTDEMGLEELADKDKNLSSYNRLIREHGPLRIGYATLDELNTAAGEAGLLQRGTIREWERALIRHTGAPMVLVGAP